MSMHTATQTQADRNRLFVIKYFDDFVNGKDLDAVIRNMSVERWATVTPLHELTAKTLQW